MWNVIKVYNNIMYDSISAYMKLIILGKIEKKMFITQTVHKW